MEKQFLYLALGLLTSCSTLKSVTTIGSQSSFVLGQGKHGSYKARLENVGKEVVEIFLQPSQTNNVVSLGVLQPGQFAKYEVPPNTKVMLKNLGNQDAKMKVNLRGEKQLSMGYEPSS